MNRARYLLALGVLLLCASTLAAREWTDLTGKFKVQADFVAEEQGKIKLRTEQGKTVRVSRDRLSKKDRAYVEGRVDFQAFDDLKSFMKSNENQAEVEAALEGFLANTSVPTEEHDAAKKYIEYLEKLEANSARHDELYAQAITSLRRQDHENAILDLRRASKLNPDSMKADLAAGVFMAVAMHDFKKAEARFRIPASRGKKTGAISDQQRQADYISVINNLALLRLRQDKLNSAYALWDEIRQAKIEAPAEVVSNLLRVRSLIGYGMESPSPKYFHVSEEIAERYEELYVDLAADRGGHPYGEGTGWLFMLAADEDELEEIVGGEGTWHACEDRICMVCSGTQLVECPNSKCKKGTVRKIRYGKSYKKTAGGVVTVNTKIPYRAPCETCRGRGGVHCEYCTGGRF